MILADSRKLVKMQIWQLSGVGRAWCCVVSVCLNHILILIPLSVSSNTNLTPAKLLYNTQTLLVVRETKKSKQD